jgi:hypothetical protein
LSLVREVWLLTADITTAVLDSPVIGQCEERLFAETEVELRHLLDRQGSPPPGTGYIGNTEQVAWGTRKGLQFDMVVLTKEPVTADGQDDTVTAIVPMLQEGQGILVNDIRTGCCYEDDNRMVAFSNGIVAKRVSKDWIRIWRDTETALRTIKRNNRVVQRKDHDSKGIIQDFAELRELVNNLSLRIDRAGEHCLREGFSRLVEVPRRTLSSEGWTAHRRPSLVKEIQHMQLWFKCSPRLCPGLLKAVVRGAGYDGPYWGPSTVSTAESLIANKKRFLGVAQRIEGAGRPVPAEWGWLFKLAAKIKALQAKEA